VQTYIRAKVIETPTTILSVLFICRRRNTRHGRKARRKSVAAEYTRKMVRDTDHPLMAGQQQHTGADNVDDAGIADHPAVPREPVGLRLVAADALPLRKHMKNKKSVDGPDDGPDDDLLRSGGVVQQRGGKRCLRQGQREDV
jgi:hypothetical protein